MKVVLVYDTPEGHAAAGPVPADFGAEYEDARTIESLLRSIRACGHEAEGLVFDVQFPERIRRLGPDMVFNIAEGVRGRARESLVPGWLEHLGIPYTGSDGLTLALSLDKAVTKALAGAAGIRTPAFRRVRRMADLNGLDLAFPLFVKPNGEGSSMGIRRASRTDTPEQIEEQVAWVLAAYGDCLVEAFAPGPEYCVGILGDDERLLSIVQVQSPDAFYHYEDKSRHRKELICPAEVSDALADEMNAIGLRVFRALGCRDLARVDLKLDAQGRPMFLEINPLPGLSPYYSLFTRQAEVAGLSHEQLIGAILDSAWRRTRDHEGRSPS